jgi:hypothetical protein
MWSDMSPIVKAVVAIGAVGILVAVLVWTGVIGGGVDETVTQQRGLQPAAGAAATE